MTDQVCTVPSREFWGITPFTISCPDGWQARQTPSHLVYMDVEGESGTNFGLQWKRVSPKLEIKQIAQMSHNVTRKIDPDVKVQMSRFGRLNGWTAYTRLSSFTVDGVKKGKIYVTFFGPSLGPEKPIELFELVGHFDASNPHRSEDIDAIVSSFRFTLGPAEAASADTKGN